MNKIIIALVSLFFYVSCTSLPRNFTYSYSNTDTGLAELINMDGYYISEHGCDSTFYSMYMFYPTGLFLIATTSAILPELVACFEQGSKSKICDYPLWGLYRIEGNRIKTQVIRREGSGCVIFRDYLILPNKGIMNVSDYVQPEYTNLGYMKNYPSFTTNECLKEATFHYLKTKRDISTSPFVENR